MSMSGTRTIARVVRAKSHGPITRLVGTLDMDGAGTQHDLSEVDPFILLDYAVIPKMTCLPLVLIRIEVIP